MVTEAGFLKLSYRKVPRKTAQLMVKSAISATEKIILLDAADKKLTT